jgi:hypothetical protein
MEVAAGRLTDSRFAQPSNAELPIEVALGRLIAVRSVRPENTPSPMDIIAESVISSSTAPGIIIISVVPALLNNIPSRALNTVFAGSIVIAVKLVQSLKALPAIVLNDAGKFIAVRLVQPENAHVPMSVATGRLTEVRFVQRLNTPTP